ncbi:MAG: hypothetical protein QOG80_1707 [Pseudonocardiales bacterium]|nr:hypothetical protein [Pseudonocardiales bacterium]
MDKRSSRVILAAMAVAMLTLSACTSVVNGTPAAGVAPNSALTVIGDTAGPLDTTVKNALSDVFAFWKQNYPRVSAGKAFPALKGGLYSVDGFQVLQERTVRGPAAKNACIAGDPGFIIDNAAFCSLDDSVIWDRAPDHLISALLAKYGPLMVALVFAHEMGHAIQYRLGILRDHSLATIDIESQADCAAGAFLGSVLKGSSAHFRATPADIDRALLGYLQVRDPTPVAESQISHGNGFDRLNAVDDGLLHGATFCYAKNYFDRQFTERPFLRAADYQSGGNEPLDAVLNPNNTAHDPSAGGLQPDLNRFWTNAATSIGKKWAAVRTAVATRPPCAGGSSTQFGYCPADNTVYYNPGFAARAYNSLNGHTIDDSNANVTIVDNQPADFALGSLFALAWGMAVRHQLFGASLDDKDALLAAACYSGAYAKDVNRATNDDGKHPFLLSPPDMDEAASAMFTLVGLDQAFGARGTTGLQRVQSFVTGYAGGLSVC